MTIIADENATDEDEDATDDAGRNISIISCSSRNHQRS